MNTTQTVQLTITSSDKTVLPISESFVLTVSSRKSLFIARQADPTIIGVGVDAESAVKDYVGQAFSAAP